MCWGIPPARLERLARLVETRAPACRRSNPSNERSFRDGDQQNENWTFCGDDQRYLQEINQSRFIRLVYLPSFPKLPDGAGALKHFCEAELHHEAKTGGLRGFSGSKLHGPSPPGRRLALQGVRRKQIILRAPYLSSIVRWVAQPRSIRSAKCLTSRIGHLSTQGVADLREYIPLLQDALCLDGFLTRIITCGKYPCSSH